MVIFTTSTGTQEMYFIPRVYDTANVEVILTDDITFDDATSTSQSFTRVGDLIRGDLSRLQKAATEVISIDYAKKITSKVITDHDAVLLTFPKPKFVTNCFYIYCWRLSYFLPFRIICLP